MAAGASDSCSRGRGRAGPRRAAEGKEGEAASQQPPTREATHLGRSGALGGGERGGERSVEGVWGCSGCSHSPKIKLKCRDETAARSMEPCEAAGGHVR